MFEDLSVGTVADAPPKLLKNKRAYRAHFNVGPLVQPTPPGRLRDSSLVVWCAKSPAWWSKIAPENAKLVEMLKRAQGDEKEIPLTRRACQCLMGKDSDDAFVLFRIAIGDYSDIKRELCATAANRPLHPHRLLEQSSKRFRGVLLSKGRDPLEFAFLAAAWLNDAQGYGMFYQSLDKSAQVPRFSPGKLAGFLHFVAAATEATSSD